MPGGASLSNPRAYEAPASAAHSLLQLHSTAPVGSTAGTCGDAIVAASPRISSPSDGWLRRRFSFLEMEPDAHVLASWLHCHVPAAGPTFAERVVTLFERLNARLRAELGPQAQVSHSYFMVDDLDEARLRVVWQHHVWPLLEEHFHGHCARLSGYNLDHLLDGDPRRAGTRRRKATIPD
jgi:hypothetical protein